MKLLYTVLFLLAVALASPRAAVCRARPNCDPRALRPCAPVLWGEAPSAACCAKLRKQRPCLCKYRKNPQLSKYIKSRDVMKVVAACRLGGLGC